MASGILGGGLLQPNVQTIGYTTPAGKTTTASLLLSNSGTAGYITLSLASTSVLITVPVSGIVTLTGIVLAAGQSVSFNAGSSSSSITYILTGWESTT